MAIVLTQVDSTCDLVFTEDPDVMAPEGADGWVPAADCEVQDGATIVKVRPLNGWEKLEAQALAKDDNPLHRPYIERLLDLSIVSVDGSAEAKAAFLAAPSGDHLLLLVNAALSLTNGPLASSPSD